MRVWKCSSSGLVRLTRPLGFILVSGASSVVPIGITLMSLRVLSIDQAAILAVSLTMSGYAAQLLTAFFVESKLAEGRSLVSLPRWLSILAVLAACVWCAGLLNPLLIAVATVPLLAVLECTRCAALSVESLRSEIRVASLLTIVVVCGLIWPSIVFWVPMPLAIALAICMRVSVIPVGALNVPRSVWGWVLAETAVAGLTLPAVTVFVFIVLGPEDIVAFRLVLSILGLFAPILGVLRLRLLARESIGEAVLGAGLIVGILAVVMFAYELGALNAWVDQDLLREFEFLMLTGTLWKIVSLCSTVPFANLRRNGKVRVVFVARCACTFAYLATCCVGVLLMPNVVGLLLSLLVSEVFACAIYHLAVRKVTRSALPSRPPGGDREASLN